MCIRRGATLVVNEQIIRIRQSVPLAPILRAAAVMITVTKRRNGILLPKRMIAPRLRAVVRTMRASRARYYGANSSGIRFHR